MEPAHFSRQYVQTNWTSIEERLPDDALCLVYAPSADPDKPLINTAWYDKTYGWSLLPKVWCDAITHWMPLPEPPEGDER